MKKLLLLLLSMLMFQVFADTPNLDNLSQKDVDDLTKELGANFVHTAVQPAGGLGKIFGFEVGLIAGATTTPNWERIVKEQDATADVGKLPHAGILGVLTIPFGITGELTFIPERSQSGVTIKNTTIGVKWELTDSLIALPFDLSVRGHMAKNELSFEDVVNNSSTGNTNVTTKVAFDTSSVGFNLTAGLDLVFIEPYIGVGYVSLDSDVTLTGNVSIFDYTTSSSASSSHSGSHIFAGANINLLFLNIGAEYSRILDTDRFTGKLSIGF